jgi:hypothetical protein
MTEKIDHLVPDRQAREEVGGISAMSLWRWDHHRPELGFPPAIKINGRNYRSRLALEEFKARMIAEALQSRSDVKDRRERTAGRREVRIRRRDQAA